ncbi:Xanthine dehydrogenase, FAD binding subunit (EC [Olavius sp. associated proteobacterium Delta 1]|nr:Xanthine dehydrogenase, FAD binding subunit (EC [Olavius sp. associated proteobacterium Delta 1]
MFNVDYIRPQTLPQALAFLGENAPDTAILAGGTDVMVDMRSGELNRRYLLDVGRLAELRQIEITEGELTIGAATTISEIGKSEMIERHAPALRMAADKFASRQVRNIATIGGNVAHCSPCGDTIPPLLIHDAAAGVVSPAGQRNVPIEEMAGGPYHCTLGPNELITHFILKPKPEAVDFADFQKIGRRKELAIARMSMAAMIARESDRSISFIRFALGSCTPTPHRFRDIENYLFGKIPDEGLLRQAGRMLSEGMLEITGRRPSAIYKEPAIQGLFMRMMYPLTR